MPTEDRNDLFKRGILEALALTSSSNPMLIGVIGKTIGFEGYETETRSWPQLRALIRELRLQGQPIGSTQGGYYIIRSDAGMATFLDSLRGRVSEIKKVIEALEKKRFD